MISAFDFVEHLYDLPGFLTQCAERLSAKGILLIVTGDVDCVWSQLTGANWWYARYPEHVGFPSRKFWQNQRAFRLVERLPTFANSTYDRPKVRVALDLQIFQGHVRIGRVERLVTKRYGANAELGQKRVERLRGNSHLRPQLRMHFEHNL